MSYTHPHPNSWHVMRVYRAYLVSCLEKWGTARVLIHGREIWTEYLAARRLFHICRKHAP